MSFESRLEAIERGRNVSRALVFDRPRGDFIAFDCSPGAIAEAAFFGRPLHLGGGDFLARNDDGTYTSVHHCSTCDYEVEEARRMSDPGDEDRT